MSAKSEKSAKGENSRHKGRGEFFAVDRRCWGAVCGLRDKQARPMSMAAAYLVLACFSDRTNVETRASVSSVEKYAGLTRGRAKDAIKALIANGAVEALLSDEDAKAAGPRVTRYRLRPWSEFRAVLAQHYSKELGAFKTRPNVEARSSHPSTTLEREFAAQALVAAGLALPEERIATMGHDSPVDLVSEWILEVEPEGDPSTDPEWQVWLPNALVRGARNETPPAKRAVHSGAVDNLRVLVELYAEHDLAEDGGVKRSTWCWCFQRVWSYLLNGQHAVYAFECGTEVLGGRLCRALGHRRLEAAIGWVETSRLASRFVFVAVDAMHDAQPLYPIATYERQPSGKLEMASQGTAAKLRSEMRAARHRISDERVKAAFKKALPGGAGHLVLVDASFTAVALVGILRLRYRPRTAKTSRWWRLEGRNCADALRHFRRIGRTAEELAALDALEAKAKANDGAEASLENAVAEGVS